MINIYSKRVAGFGKGKEMNFPTINFFLEKLPVGISEGLWASTKNGHKTISLVSKFNDGFKIGFRVESHVINTAIFVQVNEMVNILFLKKLREPKTRVKNIQELIKEDKELVSNFFDKIGEGCLDCELCYMQDHGYSNYTVESTEMGCYVADNTNSNIVKFIDSYEPKYNAIDCRYFSKGEFWELDVDGESESPTDEWLNEKLKPALREVKLNTLLGNG